MKKTALALAVLLMLALPTSAIAGIFSVTALHEFPDWVMEEVIPVPEGTKLPVVTIFNPQNSTSHASKNVLLNFSVITEKSSNISLVVTQLYYIASWQINRTNIDMKSFYSKTDSSYPSTFSISITNVPEGPCWLQVYAVANAFAYETGRELTGTSGPMKFYTIYYVAYESLSSSTVEFKIDTKSPSILSLLVENKTYHTTNVPLTLTTNEPVSKVTYSLDEQANVTVAGNATLSDLPYGSHKVTVYATDNAGNTGTSETIYFSVDVPLPTTLVIAIVAVMAIVCIVSLVYFKKLRK